MLELDAPEEEGPRGETAVQPQGPDKCAGAHLSRWPLVGVKALVKVDPT